MPEDPPKLSIDLIKGRSKSHPVPVKVFVVSSRLNMDVILDWEDPKGAFSEEIQAVGSALTLDYGLDEAPANGIWVFEGELMIEGYQCNHPLDPPEWDVCQHWEGRWRPPTDEELQKLKGVPPTPGQEEERYL